MYLFENENFSWGFGPIFLLFVSGTGHGFFKTGHFLHNVKSVKGYNFYQLKEIHLPGRKFFHPFS